MATGIVSIAAHTMGMPRIAAAPVRHQHRCLRVLSVMLMVRLVHFPTRVLEDLRDHSRGPGSSRWSPATCVLGTQFVLIAERLPVAWGLWSTGSCSGRS